jgi:hypothetical protein
MLSEKLTRRPSRQWLLVALTVGLALAVALSMALAGDAEAKKKNKPKPVDLASTVPQSNYNLTLAGTLAAGGTAPINNPATPFTYNKNKKFVTITQVKITLSCADCDTGVGDFDRDNLSLGLDGFNTGIKLNDLLNSIVPVTQTISGTPNNAPVIVALLNQDHQLNATVIKTGGVDNSFALPATLNTTLEVIGTARTVHKKHHH